MSWSSLGAVAGVPAALAAASLFLSTCSSSERAKVEQARGMAAVAGAQAQLNGTASAAQSQVAQKTVRLLITTQQVTHDVQAAAGASTVLPPDVLTRLDAGLGRLRNDADTAEAAHGGDSAGIGGAVSSR